MRCSPVLSLQWELAHALLEIKSLWLVSIGQIKFRLYRYFVFRHTLQLSHQPQVLQVMAKLVGGSWNEGNCPLFLVFPFPSLAVCMDGTLHKYTFTVVGNCFSLQEVFWHVSGHQWWPNVAEYTVSVPFIFSYIFYVILKFTVFGLWKKGLMSIEHGHMILWISSQTSQSSFFCWCSW